MTGVAGIIDPIAAARDQGLDEAAIAAEIEAGERLGNENAVAFALGLLDEAGTAAGEATN